MIVIFNKFQNFPHFYLYPFSFELYSIERLKSWTFLFISFDFSDKIWYNTQMLASRLTKAPRRGKIRPESQVHRARLPNLTFNYSKVSIIDVCFDPLYFDI